MTISLANERLAATGARKAYLDAVNGRGMFLSVTYRTEPGNSVAAAHRKAGVVLHKVTTATVRTGVEYRNLAQNADIETGALPWGQWAIYPWIIEHKGQDYARIYVNTHNGFDKVRSTHYVDGVEVSRDEYLSYFTASARDKANRPLDPDAPVLTFSVRFSGLLEVNGVDVS